MWKPGQLVTIEGKVYRVCHDPHGIFVCLSCPFIEESREKCTALCGNVQDKYQMHSYFKQLYPKT